MPTSHEVFWSALYLFYLNNTYTSRYLDDIINLDNPLFNSMVSFIYSKELKWNNANSSDTSAAFLDLDLSIENTGFSPKIYDKRDGFNFNIVSFPYLDDYVPKGGCVYLHVLFP